MDLQTSANGCYSPIGSNGFYRRGEERAHFDQQPLEAGSMVSACLEAHRITGDAYWAEKGRGPCSSGSWDATTWGFRCTTRTPAHAATGLHANRVNQNQGAESTLAYLLALNEMRLAQARAGERVQDDTEVAA